MLAIIIVIIVIIMTLLAFLVAFILDLFIYLFIEWIILKLRTFNFAGFRRETILTNFDKVSLF